MNAVIITIGDEILIGQTLDTNSQWMATELNLLGVKVVEILSISDRVEHIKEGLDRALSSADVVLITGGLGPTEDDVTKKTLAAYFDSKLVLNEEIWNDLKRYFESRKRPILESVKSMAYVPEKCQVIRNKKGTAASMWFEENEKVVVSMPGVPHEMKDMMSREILPKLAVRSGRLSIYHRTIQTVGLGEAIIAEKIKDVFLSLPDYISLAYLPGLGSVKLRLSGSGNYAQTDLQKEVDNWVGQIASRLPKYVFGYDKDQLETKMAELLLERNASMCTAESCTGGYIAHKITSVAGSSQYFKGGVVTYSNELKMKYLGVEEKTLLKHGAVSEATVLEMAEGAVKRLDTDYAVAVSGVAGPGGGSKEKPVGTVWVGVASRQQSRAQILHLTTNREINIPLSATLALNELRKFILGL